jgi:hypothetical protein
MRPRNHVKSRGKIESIVKFVMKCSKFDWEKARTMEPAKQVMSAKMPNRVEKGKPSELRV